jgi:hypothetical protein
MYKSLSKAFLGSLLILATVAGTAAAQYQAIPDFTGIGAGFNFRQAINQRFSGAQPIAPQFAGLSFANLPAEPDGLLLWCKDCQATAPCNGGGAGAWAKGARGACSCAIGALEQDFNANGHNIVAASSVKADQPGDPQYRELLVPGSGIAVGNGATPPFTVIDESANISGHLNGTISVKAPPYLAKGDGATDDTAAIQAAVNASCAASGSNKPEVYLPATPGGLCYKTTAPIVLNCSLKFNGGGWQQTRLCQNYFGPTIIAQAAEAGWKPPLTANVKSTWHASTRYGPGGNWPGAASKTSDIIDTNGNLEVQTFLGGFNGCTSGTSQPAWPTSPQGATTSDNDCVWVLATTGGQTSIASGTGSSLDADDSEFFNGANYGLNSATMEIMNAANLEGTLNGFAQFTVEFYVEPFFDDGGGFDNLNLIGIHAGIPEPNNPNALTFLMNGAGCSGGSNCLRASADIGGSSVTVGAGTTGRLTEFKIHHVALTYDGSTLRLFIDGVLAASTPASGSWTIPPYESFEWADLAPNTYLGMGTTTNELPAFYDSIRISSTARYISNFTPPTAKFTADAHTMFLENFPTTSPIGTIQGYSGVNGGTNVFIPVETSNGAALDDPLYIGNMQLSDNGIWATWMLNSTIENIQISGAGRTCVNLHDNDFQDTVRRVFCSVVPAPKTNVGFLFLNQSGNNLYDHLQCDGQYSCVGQVSGSGHYIIPDFTDRGFAVAPLYFAQAQALLDSPELDIEDTAPNQIAAVYSSGAYAPIVINGGQLTNGATGNAYLAINGGAPFIVNGTDFQGGSPAELLNVIANPSSPVAMRDVVQPSGVASTNAGKSWWLNESLGGQDPGVKFADLPNSVTNGVRRYCADCDPPANPPVACTSVGARTGAWVNGLNGTWICVP